MECFSALKKKELLPFATVWVDAKEITLSKISQTWKDKYGKLGVAFSTFMFDLDSMSPWK
jgi:hypothetical protein